MPEVTWRPVRVGGGPSDGGYVPGPRAGLVSPCAASSVGGGRGTWRANADAGRDDFRAKLWSTTVWGGEPRVLPVERVQTQAGTTGTSEAPPCQALGTTCLRHGEVSPP